MSAESFEVPNVLIDATLAAEPEYPVTTTVAQVSEPELAQPSQLVGKILDRVHASGLDYCLLARAEEEAVAGAAIALHRQQLSLLWRMLSTLDVPSYQLVRWGEREHDLCRWEWASAGKTLKLLRITVVLEIWKGTQRLLSSEQILSRRRMRDGRWTSSAEDELRFLLATTPAGPLSSRQTQLRRLVRQLQGNAVSVAAEVIGRERATHLVSACNDPAGVIRAEAHGRLTWRAVTHPAGLARRLAAKSRREFDRWWRPTGVFVVLLGPDGVGKSTTRRELVKFLQPLFDTHRMWHFRPRVIGRVGPSRPPGAPHSMPARSRTLSVLYLLTLVLDCWLGYLWRIRPLLVRSGLIILDRYYYDLLVDAKRYRYGGPKWLPRLLRRFVPPRDLMFLVLDAEAEVIYSRKRELPLEELVRQRTSYVEWAANHSNAVCVRSDAPVEQVAAEAARGLLKYMATRVPRPE